MAVAFVLFSTRVSLHWLAGLSIRFMFNALTIMTEAIGSLLYFMVSLI